MILSRLPKQNYNIAIVSSGRADTFFAKNMTATYLTLVPYFVHVPQNEYNAYEEALQKASSPAKLRALPPDLPYHQALDWVCRLHYSVYGVQRLLLADDDRSLTYWPDQSINKAPRATPLNVVNCLDEMAAICSPGTPLVGSRLRGFCWSDSMPLTLAGKCVGLQMLYLPEIVEKFRFAWQGKSMHDHHMLATLLKAGRMPVTYNKLLNDDKFGHMHPSGCGQWRTIAMHTEAAKLMQAEFPEAVRAQLKKTIDGEQMWDIVFSPRKLLNFEKHIDHFGVRYLRDIKPYVKPNMQQLLDAVEHDYYK